jgi:hypothetical protein
MFSIDECELVAQKTRATKQARRPGHGFIWNSRLLSNQSCHQRFLVSRRSQPIGTGRRLCCLSKPGKGPGIFASGLELASFIGRFFGHLLKEF